MGKLFLTSALAAALTLGCSTQQLSVRMALPLAQTQYQSIQEESDPALAEQAIPANLKMLEGFLKEDGSNPEILVPLAEGFCGYAFSFIEDKDPERASALYSRGRGYAEKALALDKDLDELGLDQFKETLSNLNASDLPAMYWLGQCWGGWLMLNLDNPEAFVDISKIEWWMLRVLELDETYHYAGPHLFLGGFYGSRTKLLGGDPEKARLHFDRNLELTDNRFLLTHFLYARTYAVQMQDRELFESLLNTVMETPADVIPQQRLANEVAKTKAKQLMDRADELF